MNDIFIWIGAYPRCGIIDFEEVSNSVYDKLCVNPVTMSPETAVRSAFVRIGTIDEELEERFKYNVYRWRNIVVETIGSDKNSTVRNDRHFVNRRTRVRSTLQPFADRWYGPVDIALDSKRQIRHLRIRYGIT